MDWCISSKNSRQRSKVTKIQRKSILDCWADADHVGLFDKENHEDPTSTKSRTGFVIILGDNLIVWKSSLQAEIATSIIAAEYIALSTAMKSLIHLHKILKLLP